jgi:hypothetical protein
MSARLSRASAPVASHLDTSAEPRSETASITAADQRISLDTNSKFIEENAWVPAAQP